MAIWGPIFFLLFFFFFCWLSFEVKGRYLLIFKKCTFLRFLAIFLKMKTLPCVPNLPICWNYINILYLICSNVSNIENRIYSSAKSLHPSVETSLCSWHCPFLLSHQHERKWENPRPEVSSSSSWLTEVSKVFLHKYSQL